MKTLSKILGHTNVETTIPVPNINAKTYAVPTDDNFKYYYEKRVIPHVLCKVLPLYFILSELSSNFVDYPNGNLGN